MLDKIQRLEKINKQIAKLTVEKEQLTVDLITEIRHNHEGQKSYEVDKYKLEVRTPMNYKLDKKAYEQGYIYLPEGFNPIDTKVAYTVNKKRYNEIMSNSPDKVQEALHSLITLEPGKPSIKIGLREAWATQY